MKVLKYFAALSAVVLTAAACKTQPKSTGNTTPDAIQAALNDAINQIGGVAGLAGYRQVETDTTGVGGTITRTVVNEFHIDNAYTKFVQPVVTVYNGTGRAGAGEKTFSNEVVLKSVSNSSVTTLIPGDDYNTSDFSYLAGGSIDESKLGSYRIVRVTPTATKSWTSTNIGGSSEWRDINGSTETLYVKEDDNKLYIIGVVIDYSSSKAVQFVDDPLNPPQATIYTKK